MCDRVIPRQSIMRHNQSGVYLHKALMSVYFSVFYAPSLRTYVMSSTVKRKQFSLEEKKNIISEVDKGLKKGEMAKKYGISPSTLSTILKDRESILKQLQTSVFVPSRKRMRKAQFEDVDTAVCSFQKRFSDRSFNSRKSIRIC